MEKKFVAIVKIVPSDSAEGKGAGKHGIKSLSELTERLCDLSPFLLGSLVDDNALFKVTI